MLMKNQKTIFPKRRLSIFIVACLLLIILFILFSTPFLNRTLVSYDWSLKSDKIFDLEDPITSGIQDYFVINIAATNTESVQYPSISAEINWKSASIESFKAVQGQKFKIFVDGISHNYYIPLGENKYWTTAQSGSDAPPIVNAILLELPQIEGIDFSVYEVELKRRIFFPLDVYLNLQIKEVLEIQPSFLINRFLMPAYIMLILTIIMAGLFQLIFKNYLGPGSTSKVQRDRNTATPAKLIIIASVSILFFFSFYFLSIQVFTIKSYWNSYKKYIQR